jgi:hypothetical protein
MHRITMRELPGTKNTKQWLNDNEIQSDRMICFSLYRERDQQRQAIHKVAITNVAVSQSILLAGQASAV